MKILIVEPDPDEAHRMTCVLSPIDCELTICHTVVDGRAYLNQSGIPALILANLFLQDGVSLGLFTWVRRRNSTCVLALMTGDPVLHYGELRLLVPDADFILFKPLLDDLLLTFVAHQVYPPWQRAAQARANAAPHPVNPPPSV